MTQSPRNFDPVWYLQANADVARAGVNPTEHFNAIGQREGRLGYPLVAFDLDHQLWRGRSAEALIGLLALTEGNDPVEKGVAAGVLARWYAALGDWRAVKPAIATFFDTPEAAVCVSHPGPFLLGLRSAVHDRDFDLASDLIDRGIQTFGLTADFNLARFQLGAAKGHSDLRLSRHLSRIYSDHDLAPVSLMSGEGCRFDRLRANAVPIAAGDLPLVSVIVPVYNAAPVLHVALRCLEAQDWHNIEVLIVDDGSTDNSAKIAREWTQRDKRFRLISMARNGGAYAARNAGFFSATGAYVTVHDADDWSHPAKITEQVRPLIRNPARVATLSQWVRADDDLGMTKWRMDAGWVYRNISSLMVRASVRDHLGYWDRVRVNGDTEYYDRLIAVFGGSAIEEVRPGIPLAFGRTAATSLTMQSETHLSTQFVGLRRDYMDAARFWHANEKELHMVEHPVSRVFNIDAAIGVGDPAGPKSDYDVLRAAPEFDADWYRAAHSDVTYADICPVAHYLVAGAAENRDPGPGFSTGGYRIAQGLGDDENPLLHWISQRRQTQPLPSFGGALDVGDRPAVLVFAHQAGKVLFGAERSFLDMLRRLWAEGQAPVVVVPDLRGKDYLAQLQPLCVQVEVCPQLWRYGAQPPRAETVARIRSLIRKHQARTVHINTSVLDAPLIAARAEGCVSVVHVRELPAEDPDLCRSLAVTADALRDDLLQTADQFVANSAVVARWLDCPDRTSVRGNSVDEALFDLPFDPGSVLRVAMISSNIAKKGIADFLEVARLVEASGVVARFILIGPPTNDLHALRPWPQNVEYAGYAEGPVTAMKQADIVLSLSHFAESFGRTVLEAMAAGRPVVCYARGAPVDLVDSGETGFVVPADDPQVVADAVMAICCAPQGLLRLSKSARHRARQLNNSSKLA
ncbi:MAG: glycosyltransferase [Sulfitobacter sp.]